MIPLQRIQKEADYVIDRLRIKQFDARPLVDEIQRFDERRRTLLAELEKLRAESNRIAKQVGIEMGKGNKAAADDARAQTAELKQRIGTLEDELAEVHARLDEFLLQMPNLPHDSVHDGTCAADNRVLREATRGVDLHEAAQPHWELAAARDWIDWERGCKIAGSGFPVYKGKGARLQRALINYFLDKAQEAGYGEVQPPILVNQHSGYGTGQLPDKDGQMYHITEDNLYVIPTAEVPITNMFRDEILEADRLPLKLCGYTPCFRREAGSYGKDVRGLNRLHQFDKVEIVQITTAEHSYPVLEEMTDYVGGLLDSLELPYRIVLLCGGDMSFASARTHDFEVLSGAQNMWLEVSSVSNFEDYQAARLKLRVRTPESKKPVLAHTLNGSALALPRIVAALIENNQRPDGTVRIPDVLVPYTRFDVLD